MEAMKVVLLCLGLCLMVKAQDRLRVGFEEQLEEAEHEPCEIVQGAIPDWLRGDFVRQTCGSWGDLREGAEPLTYIEHLFDCVSKISAYTISPTTGEVTYSTKYYDTTNYNIWSEYGRDMTQSRVAWATIFSDYDPERAANWSGAFPDKYPAEPSVSFWMVGDDLNAVTEVADTAHINMTTFDTIGIYPYTDNNIGQPQGTILIVNPAHEQVDQDGAFYSTVQALNFNSPSTGTTRQLIYKIVNGERVPFAEHEIGEWDLSLCTGYPEPYPDSSVRAGYLHSFAITENYVIIPVTSFLLDYCYMLVYSADRPEPFFRNGYQWVENQQSRIYIFDKSSGDFVTEVQTEAFFVTHQFNAFERNGTVHIDQLTYANADIYTSYSFMDSILSPEQPLWNVSAERFSIETSDWSITRTIIANTTNGEFSGKNEAYNGVEYTYGYMITGIWTEAEPARIVKINMETGEQIYWEAPETHFPQEPIFVSQIGAVGEDHGVLVIGGFNSETAKGFMAILDAQNMTLIAEVEAPLNTPIGIHNRFYPADRIAAAASPVVNLTAMLLLLLGYLLL